MCTVFFSCFNAKLWQVFEEIQCKLSVDVAMILEIVILYTHSGTNPYTMDSLHQSYSHADFFASGSIFHQLRSSMIHQLEHCHHVNVNSKLQIKLRVQNSILV